MELQLRLRVRAFIVLAAALVTLTTAFGVLVAPPTQAVQSIPYLINFQGRLTDNSGNALSDGSYNVKFRLWTLSSGGSNVWEGDRVMGASDRRITVTNGLFNIQFGDSSQGDPALSPTLFNGTAGPYLEVELPTPATATCATNGCAVFTEGAMTPRQPMASSPYAFTADTLDGLDSAAFGQITATNTFTGANLFAPTAASTVALTVKATTAGSTNGLEVFDSGGVRQAFFDAAGALTLSKAITAPTSTNTINSLVINAGALSNVTGYAQASGGFLQSGTGTFGTGTGAVSLNGTTTVAAGKNLIMPSGTGVFQQTFANNVASNAQTLAFTNNNTGAGVTMQGIDLTPTNTSTATSGTNTLNVIGFEAGGALGGTDVTNGINFASAIGYTNFLKTPTAVLSSAGAFTGVTGLTLASGNITTPGNISTTSTGTITSATTVTGTTLNGTTGINTGAGSGTQRIDASGNLVAIGNVTGSGALTLQSGGSSTLTLTSASGTIALGSSTLQNTGTSLTLDVSNASNSTLSLTNSGGGVASISVEAGGSYTGAGAVTVSSGGATALSLDTGGGAALNIGATNATSIVTGGNTAATLTNKVANSSATAYTLQTAGGTALLVANTTASQLFVGGSASAATPVVLVFGQKTATGDPTAVTAGEYYNSANNRFRCNQGGTWQNCLPTSNASTADQAVPAAATTYLTGSPLNIFNGGLHAGTQFVWRLSLSKAAVGTAAVSYLVKYGTAGTTADATIITLTTPANTAVADTAQVSIIVTVRSVNSTTGTWTGNMQLTRNSASGGFLTGTAASAVITGTSANFNDTTAGAIVGLAITTGTGDAFTFQQVQAQALNL